MSEEPDDGTKMIPSAWRVEEIQLSGDVPPPSEDLDIWLARLKRNDKSVPKTFGGYVISSFWSSRDGKVLHLRLEKTKQS